ncbi:hypothetical protein AU210_016555 [Fusarium oxysporum f. sp. radicis-cucumerinum]|uniref:Uncharacterized protein n=1 Tax=Fusarium oxysporum f. sp. radicis-cucumerinum TaxID=327505 RepID=A0A2H3G7S2_FUSOX|nr:hypothetical protein AU210_016555 [Fusarium oxysporum f. sp. radicis-cucumerinum]
MPEFRKAELASAAVILGLAPSVLQLLSASYLDTAMLAYRRPILALLLSMSSSGVRPLTATEYNNSITKMGTSLPSMTFGKSQSAWAPVIVSLSEYIIAAATVANNVYLAYQLSLWAVCTFSPGADFLPAIWAVAATTIHLIGHLVARLGISIEDRGEGGELYNKRKLWYGLRTELIPIHWQSRLKVKADNRHMGWFLTLASVLYVGDMLQALFGTIVLSSLVFISVRDAAIIVIRLVASALFARLIVIFELAGLRTDKKEHTPSEAIELL